MANIGASKKDNSGRLFTGGGPRPDGRKVRQEEALERQTYWNSLTPTEQLKALDKRPGGSKKQRAKIEARMGKVQVQPKLVEKQAVATVPTKAKERRNQEQAKRPSK